MVGATPEGIGHHILSVKVTLNASNMFYSIFLSLH